MESKTKLVLRHKSTGLYFSYMADHTKELFHSWRFIDEHYLNLWFQTHSYAPDPNEYEVLQVRLTIELTEGLI